MTSTNHNERNENRAVVLLSGGLDSTTVLAFATQEGYSVYALSFDYGQRNRFEFEQAKRSAVLYQVQEHKTLTLDLRAIGGSSLTSPQPVEKSRSLAEIGVGIPTTYVPMRNTIFLAYALAWAEVLDCHNVFIGVNAVDTSGYPDCRAEFIQAMQTAARLGSKIGVESIDGPTIHAPLQRLSKAEIISLGMRLGVDYALTSSCYDPTSDGIPCGACDACTLRRRGFIDAGFSDPLVYVG